MASEKDSMALPITEPSMDPCGTPNPADKSHSDLHDTSSALPNGSSSVAVGADLGPIAGVDNVTNAAGTLGSNGLLKDVNLPHEVLDMSHSLLDQCGEAGNYDCGENAETPSDTAGDIHSEQSLRSPDGAVDSQPTDMILEMATGNTGDGTGIQNTDRGGQEEVDTDIDMAEKGSDPVITGDVMGSPITPGLTTEKPSDSVNSTGNDEEVDMPLQNVDDSELPSDICDDAFPNKTAEARSTVATDDKQYGSESPVLNDCDESDGKGGVEGDNKDIYESALLSKDATLNDCDESDAKGGLEGDDKDTCESALLNKDATLEQHVETGSNVNISEVLPEKAQLSSSECVSESSQTGIHDDALRDASPAEPLLDEAANSYPCGQPGDVIDPRDLVGLEIVRVTAVNSPSFIQHQMSLEAQGSGESSAASGHGESISAGCISEENSEMVRDVTDIKHAHVLSVPQDTTSSAISDDTKVTDKSSCPKSGSIEESIPSNPKETTKDRAEYCPNKSQKHDLDKDLPNTVLQHKHGMFSCSSCGFSTRLTEAFRVHLLCHTFGDLYMCMFCPTLTQEITQIRRHLEQAHSKQAVKFAHIVKPFIDKIMDALASCPDSEDSEEFGDEGSNEDDVDKKDTSTVASSSSSIGAKVARSKSTEATATHSPPILIDDNDSNESDDPLQANLPKKMEIVKTTKLECSFAGGKFLCVTCVFETHSQEVMAGHLYEHLHVQIGSSKPLCVRCDPKSPYSSHANCPVVHNMIMLLLKQKEQFINKLKEKHAAEKRATQMAPSVTRKQPAASGDGHVPGKQMLLHTDTKTTPSTSPRAVVLVGTATKELSLESKKLQNKTPRQMPEAEIVEDDVIELDGPDAGEVEDITSRTGIDSVKGDGQVEGEKKHPEHITDVESDPSKNQGGSQKDKTLLSVITYEKGNYFCRKCRFKTKLPLQFRRHLWKDVHPTNQCNHCSPEILYNRIKYCRQLDTLQDFVEQIKNDKQSMASAFQRKSHEVPCDDQPSVHGKLLSLRRSIGNDTLALRPVIEGKEHISKSFWLITESGVVEMSDASESGESDAEAELAEAIKAPLIKFPKHSPQKEMQQNNPNEKQPSHSQYEQKQSREDVIGEAESSNSQTDGSCDIMENDDYAQQSSAEEEDMEHWEVSLAEDEKDTCHDNNDTPNQSFDEVDKVIEEHDKKAVSNFTSPEKSKPPPVTNEVVSVSAPVGDPVHVLSDEEEPVTPVNKAKRDSDETVEDTCVEKKEGAQDNRNIREAMDMLICLNDAQESAALEIQLESSSKATNPEEDADPDGHGILNDVDDSDHDDAGGDHDDGGSDHDGGGCDLDDGGSDHDDVDIDDGGGVEDEEEDTSGALEVLSDSGVGKEDSAKDSTACTIQDDSDPATTDKIDEDETAVGPKEDEIETELAVIENAPVITTVEEEKSAEAQEESFATEEDASTPIMVAPPQDQPTLFQCAIEECNGWKSDSQVSFKMHCLSKHYKQSPLACHCCIETFPDEDVLIEHIKITHGPLLPYICTVGSCKFATHIMHDFRSHMNVVHKNETAFSCGYCKAEFEDREELITHMISNIMKLHKCPCCAVVTPQIGVIRAHISAQHPLGNGMYSQEVYVACRKMLGKTSASQSLFAVEQLTDADADRPDSPIIIDSGTISTKKPLILRPSVKASHKGSSQSFMCSCQFQSNELLNILWHMKTCEENRRLTSNEGSTSLLGKLPVLPAVASLEPVQLPPPSDTPETVEPSPEPAPGSSAEPDNDVRPIVILPERKKLRKQILNTLEIVESVYDRLKPCKEKQCSLCDFRTSFAVLSDAHHRMHKQRRDKPPLDYYCCASCTFYSQNIEHLKAHMQNHGSLRTLKVFQCSLCPVQMTSMDGIENHLVENHPDDEFHFECKLQKLITKCDPCGVTFKGETAYLDHLQKKHEDQLVQHVWDLYGIPIPPPSSSDPSGFCFLDESGDSDCIMEIDSEYKPGKKTKPKRKSTARKHSHKVMSQRSPVDSAKLRRRSSEVATATLSQDGVGRSRSQTDGQMQCTSCDFTCDEIQPWKVHLQGHRLPGIRSICVFFCRTCDWPSNSKKLMLEHCQTEHMLTVDQARENGYEAQNVEINGGLTQSESSQGSEDSTDSVHTKLSMSIDRYHCDNCEFSTNDIQTYNAHMITHDDDSANFMPLGGMSDDSQEDTTPSKEPPRKRKKVGSIAQVMKARQMDRDSFRFKCDECPYATNTSKHYNAHVATHLKQHQIKNGFRCAFCTMTAVVAGNVTRHLRVYHPEKPLEMVPIKNGKPHDKSVIYPDLTPSEPHKKSQDLAPVEDSYDYTKLKSNKAKAPPSIRAEIQRSQQSVRSLPLTLAKELEDSGIKIPDESIFKTHLKCPECDYSTKVRMSYIRHLKQHRAPGSPRPSQSTPRSPVGAFLNQLGIDAEHMSRDAAGNSSADDDGMLVDEDVSEEDEGDEDEEDEEGKASKPNYTTEMTKFCKKVLNKDLYQCANCVFMHRIPTKVIQHFRFKHDSFKLYRCGHCDYSARDSQRIYRHCQKDHEDQELKIVDQMSGKVYEGEECAIASIFPDELASLSVPDEIERLVKRYILKSTGSSVQTCRICQHKQEGVSLRRHLLAVHLKYLPFRCKYCLFSAADINKTIMHVRNSHSEMRVKIVRQKFKGILPELPGDDGADSVEELDKDAGNNSDNENNTEDALQTSRNSTPLDLPELSGQGDDSPMPDAAENESSAFPLQLRIESIGSVTEDGSTLLATDQLREEPQTYVFNAEGEIVPVQRRSTRRTSGRRTQGSLGGETPSKAVVEASTVTDSTCKGESVIEALVKPEPEYDATRYGVMPEGANVADSRPASPQPNLLSVKLEPHEAKGIPESSESTPRTSPEKTLTKEGGQQRLKMCKYCNYKTQWNIADVKTHMLVTHMGKYPYGCKFCEFTGRDKKRLREHSAKLHPGSPSGFRYLFNDYGEMIYSEKVGNNVVIGITLLDKKSGPVPTFTKKVINKPKKTTRTIEQHEPLDLSVPKPELGQTLGTAYSTSISTGPLSLKIKLGRESSLSPSSNDASSLSDVPSSTKTSSKDTSNDDTLPIAGPAKHLQCKMCGYTHFDLYKLKTHILLKHCMLKPYACVYCDFEELTYHKAVRHVKETHPDMPFRIRKILCEKDMVLRKKICKTDMNEARVKQQEEFKKQQMAFRKFRPFACRQCDYRTTTRAKVKYHSIRMHPGRPVQWIRLERPEEGVSKEVRLAEGSFYPGYESGGTDDTNPEGRKAYTLSLKCSKCNLVFTTDDALQRHINSEHSGRTAPDVGFYHCVYCTSVIKHKNKTKFHMRMKHPDKPLVFNYVADSRGPRFHKAQKRAAAPLPPPAHSNPSFNHQSQDDLPLPSYIKKPRLCIPDWKIRLHASETATDLYKCRACKFTTRDQFVMRNHVQAHISYLPYCCPYCNYANVKSFPVKIHVAKVHPSEVVRFVLRRDDHKEEELKQLYTRPSYLRKTPAVNKKTEVPSSLSNFPVKYEPGTLPDEVPYIPPDIPPPVDPKRVRKPAPFSTYKCVLCGAITKNHTGIKRHLMWELRYLPFMCPCCPFKCAHRFGAEKHCRSKHGVDNPEVILGHNPEREAHIANLIRQSRLPKTRNNHQNNAKKAVPPPALENEAYGGVDSGINGTLPKPSNSRANVSTSSNITRKYIKRYQSSKFRRLNAGKAKRCTLCGFTTPIFKTMVNHVVRHGPKRYGCNHCEYEGFFRYEVVKHMFKFHPELPSSHCVLDNPRLEVKEVVRDVDEDELEQENLHSVPDEDGVTSSGVSPSKLAKSGAIMVDGMEIDSNEIYMDPHGEHFLCRHCTYVSRCKDHWKNHVIKHISPRWQCGHCRMQGQVSYDLRKHIRQKHPTRGMKMFKINPLTGNNHSFGGKLVIHGGGPRWRDIATNTWYGGTHQAESGMSVTIKQEIPSNLETGLSSYSPGTIAFNCYYCTFKSHDPLAYAEHIRSHTTRRGEDDIESHSVGTASQLSWNVEADIVPHLGQAYVQLFDILKIGDDQLAKILAENGVSSLK